MKRQETPKKTKKNNSYECLECHKLYTSAKNRDRHFRRIHGQHLSFACRFCGKFFERRCDGLVHERRVHRSQVETSNVHKCTLCSRGFNSEFYLKKHIKAHQSGALFCTICRKEFFYTSQKSLHDTVFHSLDHQKYICNYCGKEFKHKGNLKTHFTIHFPDVIHFICDFCEKSFKRSEALKKHREIIHLKENQTNNGIKKRRDHDISEECICPTCGKRFKSIAKCKRHELQHKQPMFTCTFCGLRLVNGSNLKEHEKLHKPKSHICNLCGKAFAQKTGILHHLKDTHAHERKYKCSSCPKSFKHSTELHIHKREHENIGPSLKHCNTCNKDFASRPSFFLHRRKAHPDYKENKEFI